MDFYFCHKLCSLIIIANLKTRISDKISKYFFFFMNTQLYLVVKYSRRSEFNYIKQNLSSFEICFLLILYMTNCFCSVKKHVNGICKNVNGFELLPLHCCSCCTYIPLDLHITTLVISGADSCKIHTTSHDKTYSGAFA